MIHLELDRTVRSVNPSEKSDAMYIVEVFNKRGYVITLGDALDAWQDYSSDLCAGWLMLPDEDEELFDILFRRFREL